MAARFGVPIAVLALLAPCSAKTQGSSAAMLTYAYGANWDAARAQRDMLIFEYFSTWRYGDNYVYLETQNLATRESDAATAGSGATTPYGEVHARISIGKQSVLPSLWVPYKMSSPRIRSMSAKGTSCSWPARA
jgi:hypothetical protein